MEYTTRIRKVTILLFFVLLLAGVCVVASHEVRETDAPPLQDVVPQDAQLSESDVAQYAIFASEEETPSEVDQENADGHTESGEEEEEAGEEQEEHIYGPDDPRFYINLLISLFLVLFAGLCSGLTVGYLSINDLELQIKKKQGNEEDLKAAEAIEPILHEHHWLLSTLLICNAIAMESLPIFLDSVVPAYMAIAISTFLVLVFGEVLPQAYCTGPSQLQIAAKMACIVKCLMWLTCVITIPIARMLDRILGLHHETVLSRQQVENIFELHEAKREQLEDSHGERGVLSRKEIRLIKSAINLRNRNVMESMVPMEKVFMIDALQPITRQLIQKISRKCYSNILVYEGHKQNIIGYVRTKELIEFVDMRVSISLKSKKYKSLVRDPPLVVCKDTTLLEILMQIKDKRQEIFIISNEIRHVSGVAPAVTHAPQSGDAHDHTAAAAASQAHHQQTGQSNQQQESQQQQQHTRHSCITTMKKWVQLLGIITLKDVFEDLVDEEFSDIDKNNHYFTSREDFMSLVGGKARNEHLQLLQQQNFTILSQGPRIKQRHEKVEKPFNEYQDVLSH